MTVQRKKPIQPGSKGQSVCYDVGYAKPPVESQFRKGTSGNPKGRPKGAKNKAPRDIEARLLALIEEEAYRDITFREGGRLVEVPLVQAVMRATGMKALTGHAPSAKHFMDLVKLVEEKQAEQRKIEALENQVITYRWLDYDEDPDD